MQQTPDSYGQGPVIGGPDYGRPGMANQAPHQHQQHHRANVEMTPEERRIFQECNRESYFKRSMPASIFLGGLAFLGVKRGILRPHARFGAMPKMVGAAIIGYFFGKVSYMEVCREKFLTQLPNSNISIAIRKARGEEVYYEEPQKSFESSEVFERNVDSEPAPGYAEESDQSKKRFSYDDLREQHRRQRFQSSPQSPPPQQQKPVAIMSPAGQAPPSLMPPDDSWSSEPSYASRSTAKKTNKYGDEGFE